MNELSIKIKIGDREYPMKVDANQEEILRKAGKLINERIKSYKDQLGIDDKQDLLAMVAFDSIVEQINFKLTQTHWTEEVNKKVKHLDQLLANHLILSNSSAS